MADEPEEQPRELVMPFVTVTSKGGPHDDQAYTAGWEMGALDALLAHVRPPVHEQAVLAASQAQADLIAMKHGYKAAFAVPPDDFHGDWRWMVATRLTEVTHG